MRKNITINKLPSLKHINECLCYNPKSGVLYWKERPRSHFKKQRIWKTVNALFAGTIAGHKRFKKSGRPDRIALRVNGKFFTAARIIYAIMGVLVPNGMLVDHKNRNPFDNSWRNLRLATIAQNNANSLVLRNVNKTLPKGVIPQGSKFVSQMTHNRKRIYIGIFNTPEEAHAAYCAKASEIHGEFARFN